VVSVTELTDGGYCCCCQVQLSGARLMTILKGYGEYPTKYRLLVMLR